ncbi:MAG TPA: tetratricopeptide repeat protein [Dokdonella sp.]|uniref:tetratricopeptide repeat protein n=1 Tax=Dokdonella sp. TaxID=2291710 RepID=UPI002D7ECDE8|nr:tetratricopeptide repeat protein [Dokdonella sp.]HET9032879.1 tetratricopeptide repeat protein [Dokdonella sp.]
MDKPLSARLRKQIDGPRDGALLRFSIGNALMAEGDTAGAVEAFRAATGFDPRYSAAWKLLGSALEANGDSSEADAAWERGIAVAHERGDTQAAKEMQVFLRRLRKRIAP